METQNILLKYTYTDTSRCILEYAFKCSEEKDYFVLGYYEKCKEIIENTQHMAIVNLSSVVHYSCLGGHTEIIKLVTEYCDTNHFTDWGVGLCGACFNGNMDNVHRMIKKGATNWTEALLYAYTANNLEATKLMCAKGANPKSPLVQCPAYCGKREIDKVVMNRYFQLYDI